MVALAITATLLTSHTIAEQREPRSKQSGANTSTSSAQTRIEKLEGITASEHGFALWNARGDLELRDPSGAVTASANVGLIAVHEVKSSDVGWLVVGSSMSSGTERGAIALIGPTGNVEQVWQTDSAFTSVVELDSKRLASTVRGELFELREQVLPFGSAMPEALKGAALQLFDWRSKLTICREGSVFMSRSAVGQCVSDNLKIEGIWKTPPIACGEWIVGDVRADARATSPWERVVWSANSGKVQKHVAIKRATAPLSCTRDGRLVDSTVPGKVISLPALITGDDLCARKATHLAVRETQVMCIDGDGRVVVKSFR